MFHLIRTIIFSFKVHAGVINTEKNAKNKTLSRYCCNFAEIKLVPPAVDFYRETSARSSRKIRVNCRREFTTILTVFTVQIRIIVIIKPIFVPLFDTKRRGHVVIINRNILEVYV